MAALSVAKGEFGTYLPPMMPGEPLHLNLVRIVLPADIWVARTSFRSGREAMKEMMSRSGPHFFDWVLRDRSFWSFRDPRGSAVASIIDEETLEAVEVETVSLLEDAEDENAFIDLLRRSVEAQLRDDLAFHKDSRSLYFKATGPGQSRTYAYRSLQNATEADVVSVHEKIGRDPIMRHHAFSPRYQRIGDEWFISVTPNFVFTSDGYHPHPGSSAMLAGKKKLERNGSIRGQILMWRHLLVASGQPPHDLFVDKNLLDPRPRLQFVPLQPILMDVTVPEEAWKRDDPHATDLASPGGLL